MTHLFLNLRMSRSTLISLTDDRKVIQGLCIIRNHQRTVQYWIPLIFKLPILVFTFILAFIKMISSRGKSATMCPAVFLPVMCWELYFKVRLLQKDFVKDLKLVFRLCTSAYLWMSLQCIFKCFPAFFTLFGLQTGFFI